MAEDSWGRFEAIEECSELMLAYAAQGLSNEKGSESGRLIRESLNRAVEAIDGLAESCAVAAREERGSQFGTQGDLAHKATDLQRFSRCSTATLEIRSPRWNWS